MSNNSSDSQFICGVVEGFYGRPWTTVQRKDLFSRMKEFGLNAYMYAPKDDFKHRAYWRELYTVEEGDQLSALINACKESDITFYYALSPGIDIVYSNSKELSCLKRKLEQVSQFGCEAFALLFDDIEPEISATDKEVFQSFGHAQISVTNEVYTSLGCPKFIFCPTEYCSSRAIPSVTNSEYLNTIGSKLHPQIDIMWTGNRVISKTITVQSIQELSEVLKRNPVLWDNLHANDYDPKRLFLGPYSGRSTELNQHLRGVLSNPNCEYEPNFIAIHTLAQWSKCIFDVKSDSPLRAEVLKVEVDHSEEELPESGISDQVYHPRRALRRAVRDWLPNFNISKSGPPKLVPVKTPLASLLPVTVAPEKLNGEKDPTEPPPLAPICKELVNSLVTPPIILNPLEPMDASPPSLSPKLTTEIVTNSAMLTDDSERLSEAEKIDADDVDEGVQRSSVVSTDEKSIEEANMEEPLKIEEEKMDDGKIIEESKMDDEKCIEEVKMDDEKALEEDTAKMEEDKIEEVRMEDLNKIEEVKMEDPVAVVKDHPVTEAETVIVADVQMTLPVVTNGVSIAAEPLAECDPKILDNASKTVDDLKLNETDLKSEVTEVIPCDSSDEMVTDSEEGDMTFDDVLMLVDLFYLPFEYGERGLWLLNEFNWLKCNGHLVSGDTLKEDDPRSPEVQEWFEKSEEFEKFAKSVERLYNKLSNCKNRSLAYDLYPYVADVRSVICLLNCFVKWMAMGRIPSTGCAINSTFTWFSQGYKEAFSSGDQEPWIFRGGLIGELQRLLGLDSVNDLFGCKAPEIGYDSSHSIRPLDKIDEKRLSSVYERCKGYLSNFLVVSPEYCFVVECDNELVGFFLATMDGRKLLETADTEESEKLDAEILSRHPSLMHMVIDEGNMDVSIFKKLLTCGLAALKANGCQGICTRVCVDDKLSLELYNKLGFNNIIDRTGNGDVLLGRII